MNFAEFRRSTVSYLTHFVQGSVYWITGDILDYNGSVPVCIRLVLQGRPLQGRGKKGKKAPQSERLGLKRVYALGRYSFHKKD